MGCKTRAGFEAGEKPFRLGLVLLLLVLYALFLNPRCWPQEQDSGFRIQDSGRSSLQPLPFTILTYRPNPYVKPELKLLALAGASPGPTPQTAGPHNADQVLLSVYDAVNGALKANATLSGGSTNPTPHNADQVFLAVYDSVNGAIRVNVVAGGGGGGAGNPGGSPGQLEYNSSGVFGGFTMAGDCTISVPNITCTKTGGTAFGSLATSSAALAQTLAGVSHKWLYSYNATTGAFTQTQPACGDLSDSVSTCNTLPTLAQTFASASHKWLNSYNATTGAFTQTQPADTDIAGTTAGAVLYVSSGALAELSTTAYGVMTSGATNPSWTVPSANGQCFMSGASNYATTTPSFQACPSGGGNLSASGTPSQYQVGVFASASTVGGVSPSATAGVPLVSGGSSANPSFGTAVVAGGGTGATTPGAALVNLFPAGTRIGDMPYCSAYTSSACTTWSLVAGNNSGTGVLQETSGGVPSFGTLANAGLTNSSITLNGTANQLTSPGATALGGTATFAIANPFTFPGKATGATSTTSAATFNIPSGSAPSSPGSGDLWNLSGVLQFYDGSHTNSVTTIQAAPTSGHLAAFSGTAGLLVDGGAAGTGQAGQYSAVSFSSTPTFTASSNTNNSWSITLTGNVSSSTLASSAAGQYLAFKICQDSTGSRTFAWPTGFSAATTIFPTASTCTEQAFFWDGSNAQPLGPAQVSGSSLSALWYGPTGTAPGTPPSGFIAAWFDSTDNALKLKNSSGTVTAAVSTASCTNQVITAISDSAADTCTTLTLASAYFANQGTTTTVLHGNASGNPSWAGVSLANDTAANQGTTTTVLHGNASGQPAFGAVVLTTDVSGVLPVANGGSPAVADTTFTVSSSTTVNANTCSGTTQVGMTNLTTSMAFSISPATDASGVTGFGSTGGLVIDAWPTSGELNYKICNQTGSSITTNSALTFNVSAR